MRRPVSAGCDTLPMFDVLKAQKRRPAGSSRESTRDGEECVGKKREGKVGLLRSVPKNHPGRKKREWRGGVGVAATGGEDGEEKIHRLTGRPDAWSIGPSGFFGRAGTATLRRWPLWLWLCWRAEGRRRAAA